MTKPVLLLAAFLGFMAPAAFPQADPGTAADTGNPANQRLILHFLAGMATGFLAAGLADAAASQQTISGYPLFLPGVALSSAIAAGISKEALDSTGFGAPRFSDALTTVAGGFFAAGVILGVEGDLAQLSVSLFSFGVVFVVPVVIAFIQEIVWNIQKPRPAAGRP